jgi:ribosomal protein S7
MIIYYDKKTRRVFGTSNGYKLEEAIDIKTSNVKDEDIGKFVISRQKEIKHPEVVENITNKLVKNIKSLEFEELFEEAPKKIPQENGKIKKDVLVEAIKNIEAKIDEKIEIKINERLAEILALKQ